VNRRFDVIVVGGGFFGACLALAMKKRFKDVLLLERESALLARASLFNQARVHGGYHYPRSITTGLRSRENYRIFVEVYRDCISDSFKKIYAVAKQSSKVSAAQFKQFCDRISAPLRPVPNEIKKYFDLRFIENAYEVEECAFDAVKLRECLSAGLEEAGVVVRLGTTAVQISSGIDRPIAVEVASDGNREVIDGARVFLCNYSGMNELLYQSDLPLIPVRNEFTEMALVEVPDAFKEIGITVMCGPFFSIMPFPSRGLHSLSHVRYTPHFSWVEDDLNPPVRPFNKVGIRPKSRYAFMQKDAARFVPRLKELKLVESFWEVKTLLPRNEKDDARPILFKRDHGIRNLNCIIGGKIDNIFDVLQEIE